MTRRFALLGHPVSHSLSPVMHNAAFRQLKLDACYELWDVAPENLGEALDQARAELCGFNVTVPHKPAVFEAAADMHEVAKQVGAVNTVKVEQGRLRGRNTDVFGIQRACSDVRFAIEGAHVLVLGNGGAARACVVAAARARAASVTVAARNLEKAMLLSSEVRNSMSSTCPVEAATLEHEESFANATFVFQATSATLSSSPEAQAFADSLPLDRLPANACVMDLVYKPSITSVMARAKSHGLRVANGLGMLLHQGAAAFEWWTGDLAPVDLMREVLVQASED